MNQIRKHYFMDKYVLIASDRGKRPRDFEGNKKDSSSPENCPFCKGNEDMTPGVVRKSPEDDWKIRMFPNKFPALSQELDFEEISGEDLFQSWKAHGVHEVIVETPDHDRRFSEFSEEQAELYIKEVEKRYREVKSKKNIEFVGVFRNVGEDSGASIDHLHSQIMASPIIPDVVQKEVQSSESYFEENSSCPYCDIVEEEKSKEERIVLETDNFLVITPYASLWPYQILIIPKSHFSEISELSDDHLKELSELMKEIFEAYDDLFDNLSYNMIYRNFPKEDFTHFRIDIYPRLSAIAGGEFFGININEVKPEDAAEELKKVLD